MRINHKPYINVFKFSQEICESLYSPKSLCLDSCSTMAAHLTDHLNRVMLESDEAIRARVEERMNYGNSSDRQQRHPYDNDAADLDAGNLFEPYEPRDAFVRVHPQSRDRDRAVAEREMNDDEDDQRDLPAGMFVQPSMFKSEAIVEDISKMQAEAQARHPGEDVEHLWCFLCGYASPSDPTGGSNPLVTKLNQCFTQSLATVSIRECCVNVQEFFEKTFKERNPEFANCTWELYTIWMHYYRHSQASKMRTKMRQIQLEEIGFKLATYHLFFRSRTGAAAYNPRALNDLMKVYKMIDTYENR